MSLNLSLSRAIFEPLNIVSNFDMKNKIWKIYSGLAIKTIQKSTIELRGSLHYINGLSKKEALHQRKSIEPLVYNLLELQNSIQEIKSSDFQDYKKTFIEFIDVVDEIYHQLLEKSGAYDKALKESIEDAKQKKVEKLNLSDFRKQLYA